VKRRPQPRGRRLEIACIAALLALSAPAAGAGRKAKPKPAAPAPAPAAAAPAPAASPAPKTEAPAGDTAKTPAPAGKTRAPKVNVYSFSGLDLEGKLKTPQLLYFLNRSKMELETSLPDKRSFMKELERTSEADGL